jgi:hypothetical protein
MKGKDLCEIVPGNASWSLAVVIVDLHTLKFDSPLAYMSLGLMKWQIDQRKQLQHF